MNFKEKVSLITGSARGIGFAIADSLAAAGSHVIIADLSESEVFKAVSDIEAKGGKASGAVMNVADRDSVEKAVESIIERTGAVHHLVNNAGITRDNLLMRMKYEEWDAVMSVNLTGSFNVTKAVIRAMTKNHFGRIVNIASVIGQMGNAGQTNYGASKAGLIGFTKSLAREVASRGITVNAVTPGYIITAMTDNLPENAKEALLSMIPSGRLGIVDDISFGVKFLLSDEAGYITGTVLNINGGMYM